MPFYKHLFDDPRRKELALSLLKRFGVFFCIAVVVGALVLLIQWSYLWQQNRRDAAAARAAAIGDQLQTAIDQKDIDGIRDKFGELQEANPAERPQKHLLYVAALLLEEDEVAEKLQNQLAPVDGKGGYALTHYLVALNLLARSTENTPTATLEEILFHLQAAAESDDIPAEVQVRIGDCLMRLGRNGKAIDTYRKIEPFTPEIQFRIATAIGRTENRAQFPAEMRLAAEMFEKKVADNPKDHRAFVNWTKALFNSGLIDQAEELLMERLEKDNDDLIRNELIQSYLARLKVEGDIERRKTMLKRICDLDPDMEINQKTREAFFSLGNYLTQENRFEEAEAYYLASARRIELPPAVKNNLAWIEMNRTDGDLEKALRLVNEAIGNNPDETESVPEFHGTRGQILTKLGRWKQALPDLEIASLKARVKDESRLSLAVVYSKLGKPKLAQRMFQLAQPDVDSLKELLEEYPE